MSLYLALVHYPVSNKNGEIVSTSITNLDIHDLSRSGRTFGCEGVFIVTPVPSQQWFARRIIVHWSKGVGAVYNPTRREALEIVRLADDVNAAVAAVEADKGRKPFVVATTAKERPGAIGYAELRRRLETTDDPYLLLFGTGWGLHESLFEQVDFTLAPVRGPSDYNHLSVRAAVAIILDRLRGER